MTAPAARTGVMPVDLAGRLAQLLAHHHAERLLASLFTILAPLVGERPAAERQRLDVATVKHLHRLLEAGAMARLLPLLLDEVGPYLIDPDQPLGPAAAPAGKELTERELQVLTGMASGRTNAHIGRGIFITEDTVKTHARRLFRKLGVTDRAHAVAVAYQRGYLPTGPSAVAS